MDSAGHRFDIKCDYCDVDLKDQLQIPDDWLSCHLRVRKKSEGESFASYTKRPTVCPEHKYQLYLVFLPERPALEKEEYLEKCENWRGGKKCQK